ncbi:MAG: hypothetical protein ACTSP5_06570, partial [Candidatus Heimdallarchaeota archaeon]
LYGILLSSMWAKLQINHEKTVMYSMLQGKIILKHPLLLEGLEGQVGKDTLRWEEQLYIKKQQ